MKKIVLLSLLLIPILFSSCYIQHFNSGGLNTDVYLNEPPGRNERWVTMGSFEFKDQTRYIFFNLFAVSKVEISDVVKQEIQKYNGDGVINLTIESRLEPLDAILQLIYPFYGQRTVTIKGEVIKRK
jgi:hypothetical protein